VAVAAGRRPCSVTVACGFCNQPTGTTHVTRLRTLTLHKLATAGGNGITWVPPPPLTPPAESVRSRPAGRRRNLRSDLGGCGDHARSTSLFSPDVNGDRHGYGHHHAKVCRGRFAVGLSAPVCPVVTPALTPSPDHAATQRIAGCCADLQQQVFTLTNTGNVTLNGHRAGSTGRDKRH